MLANNVQETTTGGSGNLTLSGASENGRTFTSQFVTNERFSYFVDDQAGTWETGIGYLSGATTLVRETPLDGSASTPVTIVSGSEVFVAPSAETTTQPFLGMAGVLENPWVQSATATAPFSGGATQTANRQYYWPLLVNWSSPVDGFVLLMDSAQGTGANIVLAGIYRRNADGAVGDLVVQASSSFDPTVTTDQVVSCTETQLVPGLYYGSTWGDTSWRPRCPTQAQSIYPAMGYTGNNGNYYTNMYGNVSSLTSLPATPTAISAGSNNSRPPMFRLRLRD